MKKMKTSLQKEMKTFFLLGTLIIMAMICPQQNTYAQNVGINISTPDASAALDVKSGAGINQGILIPFVDLATATFPTPGPANGLLVHNTNTAYGLGLGIYQNIGTALVPIWVKQLTKNDAWILTGNTGTTAGTNFIGTTDAQDVVFKSNSTEVARATIGANFGIGITSTGARLDVGRETSGNIARFTTYGSTNDIELRCAGGTITTPSIIGSGGVLGRFFAKGYDGSAWQSAATVSFEADAATGAGDMPGRIVMSTTPDGTATPTEKLRISNTGAIGLSGANYGTSGQVLTSQGAATAPIWSGPGRLSNIITYTSGSATYTPAAGVTAILVKLVGGGGAGGGAPYTSCAGNYFVGGGGGAGGYCEGFITSPAASYSYSIGTGGTGTTACTTAGGSGGNTTFGSFTAGGGSGGSYNSQGTLSSTVITASGGTGGTSSGGNLNLTGASGYQGYSCSGNYYVSSGSGGSTMFGNGGPGITWYYGVYSFIKAGLNASSGALGSGGGGAFSTNSSGSVAGGNGASGIIIIYEYK